MHSQQHEHHESNKEIEINTYSEKGKGNTYHNCPYSCSYKDNHQSSNLDEVSVNLPGMESC